MATIPIPALSPSPAGLPNPPWTIPTISPAVIVALIYVAIFAMLLFMLAGMAVLAFAYNYPPENPPGGMRLLNLQKEIQTNV
jgi:hypothetical protein